MNKILFTILCFSLLPISLLADNNDEISDTARIFDIDGVFIYDNPKEAYLNLLMRFRDKSPIFDRDDFANAEAYSVFNREYKKK